MGKAEREEYNVSFFENLKLFSWVFKRVKPYWKMLSASIALMMFVSFMNLVPPYLTKNAINLYLYPTNYSATHIPSQGAIKFGSTYFVPSLNGKYTLTREGTKTFIEGKGHKYPVSAGDIKRMKITGVVMIAIEIFIIYLIVFLASYAQVWSSQMVAIKTVNDVRNILFDHILKQPMKFFDSNISGRLVTRVTNDTQNLNDMFSKILASIFKDTFLIVGILYILFTMERHLFLIILPVFLAVVMITYLFRFFSRRVYRVVRAKLAAVNAFLAEHISGMIVTFLFNREIEKSHEFYKVNDNYYRSTLKMILVYAIFRPMISFTRYFAITLLIWFGARAVVSGNVEIGTLFAFITYIGMIFQPINDMAQNFSNLQSTMVSVERIRGLLSIPLPQKPESNARILSGEIAIKNLWFSYNKDEWALKGISLNIKSGEKIAIVGHTGAGKSTISSILTGLYDYSNGSVKIGGVEVKECPTKELRTKVNIVLQEVMLFSGTVLDNITLWDKNITRSMVLKAIRDLDLEKLINSLPNGVDTHVRESGTNLSTGQRQLISIVRAFVRKPEVVIMDEATSSVDVETESMIQHAIQKLTMDRTTVIIAHRLSTIRNVNRIVVISEGEIAEEGTHEELMKKNGIYAKLYRLQSFEEYQVS